MIKTHTCYTAACDVCGEEYDDGGDGIRHSTTATDALDEIRNGDYWWIGEGEQPIVICERRTAGHLDKAREVIATLTECDERDAFFGYFPEIDPADFPPPPMPTTGCSECGATDAGPAGFPRFAPDAQLLVDAHNGFQEWSGQRWNEYAAACEQPATGGMFIVRLIQVIEHGAPDSEPQAV